MCKIRVIIKTVDSEVLHDKIHEIGTAVNPLDRPSYVEMTLIGKKSITFYYSGSQEKYITAEITDELSITYGEISGRISQYTTIHNRVEGTDSYAIKNKLLADMFSPRFENNIKEGLRLVDSLLALFAKLREGKEKEQKAM